jgi:hypothetical protein
MGDGTFAVLPLIFFQLYTILVIINNFPLPLAYGLLPNKTTKTYTEFFSLIMRKITVIPKSFNVDFDLATFKAVRKVFGKIEIYGCYFHLSQSFYKNILLKGFVNEYRNNKTFKNCFLLTQALAFLRIDDVKKGFNLLKKHAETNCTSFLIFLDYVEVNYIGKGSKRARFEINTWNVHHRVILGLPRTSNKLERFNKEFNSDAGDYHQATHDIINQLRLEQGHTELIIVRIKHGETNPTNKLVENLDSALKVVCDDYNSNEIFSFLSNIALVIEKHNRIINKSKGKKGKAKTTTTINSDSDI